MVDGSGQVFTINLSNSITNVSTSSLANALNSFVPEGYFILQQQFGIAPFLAFISVALMIMMLYYLFAYILFNNLFKNSELFNHIKRPLLVFVFALGVLSAYAIGYLVYIFEIALGIVALSIIALIFILAGTIVAGGYRAAKSTIDVIASVEKEFARAKYDAKQNLIEVERRVKDMEGLLKEKNLFWETKQFKKFKKLVEDTKKRNEVILDNLKSSIDHIKNAIENAIAQAGSGQQAGGGTQGGGNTQNLNQILTTYAQQLANLINNANAQNGIIENIEASFKGIENFYTQFTHAVSTQQAQSQQNPPRQIALSQQYIYRLILDAKEDINKKIKEINAEITMIKSMLLHPHNVNVNIPFLRLIQ